MKPTTLPPVKLPPLANSEVLAKHQIPGDPWVIVKMTNVGSNADYQHRDKAGTNYIFKFDIRRAGHVLRVPYRLWHQNNEKMAHDMMDSASLPRPLVVTIELPPAPPVVVAAETQTLSTAQEVQAPTEEAAPANTPAEQMGATDTDATLRNVVGPENAPTVAPAAETDSTSQGELDSSEPHTLAPAGSIPAPDTISEPFDIAQAAYDLVESPKRIKALAALLGVEEPALRAAIDKPESKIELAQAGWVRRKD